MDQPMFQHQARRGASTTKLHGRDESTQTKMSSVYKKNLVNQKECINQELTELTLVHDYTPWN